MPGIDDMAFHVPKLFLPIKELAKRRNIEYAKLNKGLGLELMSVPDVHEDASTMAANAVKSLIEKNALWPRAIGRIYVASESATDGSKPIATYVHAMLCDHYEAQYGPGAFLHTDVVDMTFACIAGVDALINTLDWVRANPDQMGIVVCTDIARYEMDSTGEYTQGAGAVAMLVKANPRLIEIEPAIGVATVGEHDFFKPLRRLSRKQLAESVLGRSPAPGVHAPIPNVVPRGADHVNVHSDFPVYDGAYSNECYAKRMEEAYAHFKRKRKDHRLADWDRIVFHLPYAYHGKRFFTGIFSGVYGGDPVFQSELQQLDTRAAGSKAHKLAAKTPMYKKFVNERIAKGQIASSLIGNMYTGSIFMSLMSLLEAELSDGTCLEGARIGFCSYGSGSKSKVFEGTVNPGWESVVAQFRLFRTLSERQQIDFEEYEQLHGNRVWESICHPNEEFYLDAVSENNGLYGMRKYGYGQKVLYAI